MFGPRYYGGRFYGSRYFGGGGDIEAGSGTAGGSMFGRSYFGGRFFGPRYFGSESVLSPISYTLDGPTAGTLGVRTCAFTVELVGDDFSFAYYGGVRITPDDNGAGGVFSPTSRDLDVDMPSARFTYIPAILGPITISTTNTDGLPDPPALILTIASPVRSTNLMEWGHDWLNGQLKTHVSKPATYLRGYDSVDIDVTLGSKLLKLSDDFGVRIEYTDMDFLIPAEDLVLDGEQDTPARGDLIQIAIGCDLETFEVFPFGGTEAPWRWADPFHKRIRVHTKHIGSIG